MLKYFIPKDASVYFIVKNLVHNMIELLLLKFGRQFTINLLSYILIPHG